MVVASGGWIQNANFSPNQNNSNLNSNNGQNNKMAAKGVLICRDNSHPFQDRSVSLEQPVKIGRSVARARVALNNAIFDCKVLSRNHALLWYNAGKFYLQDTKSSNGTFVNNQRLSSSGQESAAREVCSGDIVQFGVDVIESTRKVTHGCIVATLKLYLPDGKEAKASPSTSVACLVGNVSLEDLYKLNQFVQEAARREKALSSKLLYLQQLIENTRQAASQAWKALIDEDRLLSRVEIVESQLVVCSKNFPEDKIRNELLKLQEEMAQYQTAAKEALQKILQEKLEVTQRVSHLERHLNETEEECQSLHEVGKYTQTELQELASKYTETQKKLNETSNRLVESEEKMKEIVQKAEQEKQDLLKRLEDQSKIEKSLQARLQDSRLDSVDVHKQITALRNYMQTLRDMTSKLDENLESKDDVNLIEEMNAILHKLYSVSIDNFDSDAETNYYSVKIEQDNQINLHDVDSNQMKIENSDHSYVKSYLDDSLTDNLNDYILPPLSRRTLVNGNANLNDLDIVESSDGTSEATEDEHSIASDDGSEKSVVEVKEDNDNSSTPVKSPAMPVKLEVRFASEENGEQLEVHYDPVDQIGEELEVLASPNGNCDLQKTSDYTVTTSTDENHSSNQLVKNECLELDEECEGEHLEGDYIKTLKPLSKSDSIQQTLHSRKYVLQTLIGSLDSLKGEDDLEAQQLVKRELEELKSWLIHESNETVINKLKELYYRAKNETQRIQEVNEELVIFKEKYSTHVEEKADLIKKYESLKAQCSDLLNVTYSVPIHYVAPIVIALAWMLLEKIF